MDLFFARATGLIVSTSLGLELETNTSTGTELKSLTRFLFNLFE
jgi:hypothetical protein